MKMSVYLQTATSQRGQRESGAIGQKLSRDVERLQPTINVYFS